MKEPRVEQFNLSYLTEEQKAKAAENEFVFPLVEKFNQIIPPEGMPLEQFEEMTATYLPETLQQYFMSRMTEEGLQRELGYEEAPAAHENGGTDEQEQFMMDKMNETVNKLGIDLNFLFELLRMEPTEYYDYISKLPDEQAANLKMAIDELRELPNMLA
mmetsp:Transcript_21117/g.32741  ORF Transcript_21117/g.32741 Transcript_21117/m.32741 type:complete len:159 (-) Transcript_21117:647-1123(-)|eukprot:CAMPEP_0170495720 /NCGR_PEP_ID=MMETSP0208-20121228/18320_1 /TAXON_ID=197538 /ORGANISM="Strombidium inclinatum, Strain S3" /LENGTH=158 /DNA_ID=CAMNT_0010772061 /DNA_START=1753 /DNA_END=2229 /DNA_ORIENTATION=-